MRFIMSILFALVLGTSQVNLNSAMPDKGKKKVKNKETNSTWNDHLDAKVVQIWRETNNFEKFHAKRMADRWANDPDGLPKRDGDVLKSRAYELIHRRKSEVSKSIDPALLEKKRPWNSQDDKELADLFHQVNGDPTKIHGRWIKKHPKWHNTELRTLRKHVSRLYESKMIRATDEVMEKWKAPRHKWNLAEMVSLMTIWYDLYKGDVKRDYPVIREQFLRQHPGQDELDVAKLRMRVNQLLEKGFIIPLSGGGSIQLEKSERDKRDLEELKRQPWRLKKRKTLPGSSSKQSKVPTQIMHDQHSKFQEHSNPTINEHGHSNSGEYFPQQNHDDYSGQELYHDHSVAYSHPMDTQSHVNEHQTNYWRNNFTLHPDYSHGHYISESDIRSEPFYEGSSFFDNLPSPHGHSPSHDPSSSKNDSFYFDWQKLHHPKNSPGQP